MVGQTELGEAKVVPQTFLPWLVGIFCSHVTPLHNCFGCFSSQVSAPAFIPLSGSFGCVGKVEAGTRLPSPRNLLKSFLTECPDNA